MPLTIRVRASILSKFPDTNAGRAAIEALVEDRWAPGLRSEMVRARSLEFPGERRDSLGIQIGAVRPAYGARAKAPKP